jgi:hypothetical protein
MVPAAGYWDFTPNLSRQRSSEGISAATKPGEILAGPEGARARPEARLSAAA